MFVLIQRAPIPDAASWPGRRVLAAGDAIVWPVLWISAIVHAPFRTGVAGALVITLMLCFSLTRLRTALVEKEHYRFTTWRWGRPLVVILVIGAMLKAMLQLSS
jgi:hypothetical protein